MKSRKTILWIALEAIILVIAMILVLIDAPVRNLILPVGIPLMVLVFLIFRENNLIPHPRGINAALIVFIVLSLIFDITSFKLIETNKDLSHSFKIITNVCDIVWVSLTIISLLIHLKIIKVGKNQSEVPY